MSQYIPTIFINTTKEKNKKPMGINFRMSNFLLVIFSYKATAKCPPSKGYRGIALTIPMKILIYAMRLKVKNIPDC